VDTALQLVWQSSADIEGASLLRFCRLLRLARIVKVFRLKLMKDLRLMVKGLIAGIWTLSLAFVLLFAVLYVIAGFATISFGHSNDISDYDLEEYFYNIPISMFTAFRCFTGECTTVDGRSITSILASLYKTPFVLSFVVSYMLVTMGIFNVILAVYVDITMKAAKENDALNAEQYSRESLRIARCTRELLKRFAAAHHQFNSTEDHHVDLTRLNSTSLLTDDELHEDIAINKDLFLIMLQDRGVHSLMDELDIPPERAHLFEIIDADGSGTLQATELVHGLLKIRGEIKKSDTVAPLLATRALMAELKRENEKTRKEMLGHLHNIYRALLARNLEKDQHSSAAHSILALLDDRIRI